MQQITSTIFMVRPAAFGYNEETASSNAFQQKREQHSVHDDALAEFDAYVQVLRDNAINVIVVEDTLQPHTPDAVFPNNWISFHEDEKVFLYPMQAPNRRLERKPEIIQKLRPQAQIIDLTAYENEGLFLEGTGSLVLDRKNLVAYACLSPRTDAKLVDTFCLESGYRAVVFHASDRSGTAIYHTNVMMCLGERFAVICLEAITDRLEKEAVKTALEATGHEMVLIDLMQVQQFAGNMLEVVNTKGEPILVLSATAMKSLGHGQISQLEKFARLLPVSIPVIEANGGGSVRCMMAEVF